MRWNRLFYGASFMMILFYIIFLNVSIIYSFYNNANFPYINLAMGAVIVFFIVMYIGFKQYDFRKDVSDTIRMYSTNNHLVKRGS